MIGTVVDVIKPVIIAKTEFDNHMKPKVLESSGIFALPRH